MTWRRDSGERRKGARRSSVPPDPSQLRTLDQSEHLARVVRMRKVAMFALFAWPLFGLVDWFIVSFVHPGRLWFYLLCRALGLVVLVPAAIRIYLEPAPKPWVTRTIDLGVASILCTLITVTSLEFGGIASPLVLGVISVVVCRFTYSAEHWKRSLGPAVVLFLIYPVTLLAVSLASPEIAAQFRNLRDGATFLLNCLFIAGVVAILAFGGHVAWSLSRQVFQSRSLGRYKLKDRIGKGGMGEVWRAHDSALKRDVAVKILNPERDRLDPLALQRFEREVQATSELQHPNTVRVFDYGQTEDGLFYYAMELLEGEDMGDLSVRLGPIDPERSLKLISQAARALAEAHARGLVHRDLKPENLFVTNLGGERDFVKVLDFGLVRMESDDATKITREGFAVGTPAYIAPEVVRGKKADSRSDVFALGTVLYRLICGATPFGGGDMRAQLIANLEQTPPRPSYKLGRTVPPLVEAVVMRCLEKNPDARYRDGGALAVALERCLAALSDDEIDSRDEPTLAARNSRFVMRETG
ncbi:MAG: serine/threonine-protein kinase [Myxococcota bacterium]